MRNLFASKQLLYVFGSSLVVLFVGMGLWPILPLYAAKFGATPTLVGVNFGLMYAANSAGYVVPGWLAGRLNRRAMFIAAGLAGVPSLFVLGQATSLPQVMLLTAVAWFAGGMVQALAGVFAGLHADRSSRGASFSLMSLAYPLGILLGGTTVGQLVAWRGYSLMFGVLALIWATLPLIGLFLLEDKPIGAHDKSATGPQAALGPAFPRLLLLSLLSFTAISVSRLGSVLSMRALDFSPTAVASTATVSGLAAIPVVLLIGRLSDRFGRERLLVSSYWLAAAGGVILTNASELWHFWLAAILMVVAYCASGALALALTADVLARGALGRGLPWVRAAQSAASVLAFVWTGYAMDTLGGTPLYLASAGLAVVAALPLWGLPCSPRHPAAGCPAYP